MTQSEMFPNEPALFDLRTALAGINEIEGEQRAEDQRVAKAAWPLLKHIVTEYVLLMRDWSEAKQESERQRICAFMRGPGGTVGTANLVCGEATKLGGETRDMVARGLALMSFVPGGVVWPWDSDTYGERFTAEQLIGEREQLHVEVVARYAALGVDEYLIPGYEDPRPLPWETDPDYEDPCGPDSPLDPMVVEYMEVNGW